MGTMYDDARYGIEKTLTFPIVNTAGAHAAIYATLTLTEDITLVSLGGICTTAISASGALPTITISKSATALTVLGTLTVPSGVAIGSALTPTTTLTTTGLSSGDILLIKLATSGLGGSASVILRYRERFVTG